MQNVFLLEHRSINLQECSHIATLPAHMAVTIPTAAEWTRRQVALFAPQWEAQQNQWCYSPCISANKRYPFIIRPAADYACHCPYYPKIYPGIVSCVADYESIYLFFYLQGE